MVAAINRSAYITTLLIWMFLSNHKATTTTTSPLTTTTTTTEQHSQSTVTSSSIPDAAEEHSVARAANNIECFVGCKCIRPEIIRCSARDILTTIPVLNSKVATDRITEIYIANQPRLTALGSDSIDQYTKLEKLTIEYSSLQNISLDAFAKNRALRTINFRSNKITELSWFAFDGLKLTELNIEDNPIVCGCRAKWLQFSNKIFPTLSSSSRGLETCFIGNESRFVSEQIWQDCEQPRVNIVPRFTRLNVSERTEVTCTGSGSPRSRVYWFLQGKAGGQDFRVISGDDGGGLLSTTLQLDEASRENSGTIRCFADNDVGRANASWTLSVLSAPKILKLEGPLEFFHWCISYEISGLPAPKVSWFRDDDPLTESDVIYDSVISQKEAYVSRNGCLTFTIANHFNNGNYTLVAENDYGSDRRTIVANFLNSPGGHPGLEVSPQGPFNGGTFGSEDIPLYSNNNKTSSLQETKHEGEINYTLVVIIGSIIIAVIALVCLVFVIVCCKQRHQRKFPSNGSRCFACLLPERRNRNSLYCETIAREMMPLNSSHMVENPNYLKQENQVNPSSGKVVIPRIPRQSIQIIRELGEGAFGHVVLGTCKLLDRSEAASATAEGDHQQTLVAIKTLKENQAEDAKRDFDREAELLTSLQHENIVRLHGISDDSDTKMIIFEYMENGDLNNFLRAHGPDARFLGKSFSQSTKPSLSMRDLLYISNQIASGAEYLACKHFVHRDLATRNCLVGENLVVKIGDFGMSRDVYSADYYKVGGQTMLPIRWMPYESILYRTFTMESDVWSFGVVLWEIFSFGKQPWYELTNHEVIQHLEMGKVLDCPAGGHCPEEVYRLMLGCWRQHPHDRLSMSQLHVHLTRLLRYNVISVDGETTNAVTTSHVDHQTIKSPYLELLHDEA